MIVTRDFTVATFVVWGQRILLLWHPKLHKWLPPGGHIEPHELPDEAAVREVQEEAGLTVELVGERALPLAEPRQLVRPEGIQVESIEPGHEHIDLVYFARPVGLPVLKPAPDVARIGWYTLEEARALPVSQEIALWLEKALAKLSPALAREANLTGSASCS